MKAPDKSAYNLIVTGDVVVDHHIYEGERNIPAAENVRGVRAWRELGGAEAVHRLLVGLSVQNRLANIVMEGSPPVSAA